MTTPDEHVELSPLLRLLNTIEYKLRNLRDPGVWRNLQMEERDSIRMECYLFASQEIRRAVTEAAKADVGRKTEERRLQMVEEARAKAAAETVCRLCKAKASTMD